MLRAERERQGLTIDDVALGLRLRRVMIEAVESGRVDRLPGATYAVAFVRSYAEYLGLDRDEVVARFRSEADGLDQPVDLAFPIPASESRLPGGAIVMVSLLVAVGAYVFWYLGNADQNARPPRVAAVPAPLSALVDRPPAPSTPPAPSAQNAAAATISERPEARWTSPEAGDVPASPPPPPSTAPATSSVPAAIASLPAARTGLAASETTARPVARYAGRITLRATGDCWLRVRDAAGNVLITRTMKAGEELVPPDREGLNMFVGSAGALEILVDGKRVPALGAVGAVRRDVALDPDRLLAGSASEPSRPVARPNAGG